MKKIFTLIAALTLSVGLWATPASDPTDEIVLATGNWEAMGWANQPKILESGVLGAAGAKAGQTLRIYVTPAADNWACQVVSGWWSAIGTDKYPYNTEGNPYDLAAHNGALEIVLDDDNLAGFDLEGIVINGDGLVITKVALKNEGVEQTAPVVGDQFVDATSGLKFEITAVGETNTVKVIKNNYTGTSYAIPATVNYNYVDFAVTEIGTRAFDNCESLQSITIPDGVITIGEYAFEGCSALQSITIPAGVTEIQMGAFAASGLQTITIPAGVISLGTGAFYECTGLTSVTFLGNACQNAIGGHAFDGVGDPDPALLTLPNSWTGTKPDEDGNWYGGKFELSEDPAPVACKEFSFVAGEAADSDPAMFAITWGADGSSETVKMTKKEDGIYVAEILPTVDSVVLVRCATDATEIIWDGEGRNVWNQTGNYPLFDTMYFGEWTEEGLFTLTYDVEYKYTEYENWQIKHEGSEWVWTENLVKVEEGLFKLADANWTGSGFNVKSDDNPIKKDWFDPVYGDPNDFHIAEGVNPPKTVDVYLRVIDDETLKIGIGQAPPIQFVDTASGLKFEVTSMEEPRTVKVIYNDYPGTSYTVPGTVTYWEKTFDVTEIGVEAFHDCSSLESITLPESVTTLAYASLATSGLKSITIPATVTTIGEYAFAECHDLKSVTFQGNACQDTIGDNAFENVGKTTPATLTLPDDWAGSTPENSETLWYGGYFDYTAPGPRVGGKFVDETSGLKFEITSYDGTSKTVKVIANSYTSASYDIPETVTNWEETFEVTEIDAYAFAECPLETFTVPASIVEIGAGAFSNCTSLQSVTFKGNACQNDINVTAFYGVGEDTPATLTLPGNWTGAKPESSILEWFGGFCAIRQ